MQNRFIKKERAELVTLDYRLNPILCRKPQQTNFEHQAFISFKLVQSPLNLLCSITFLNNLPIDD